MILNHQNWPTFFKKRWFSSPRICIQVLSMWVCRKDSQPPKLTYFFKKTLVFQPKNLQFFLMGLGSWKNTNNLRYARLSAPSAPRASLRSAWTKVAKLTLFNEFSPATRPTTVWIIINPLSSVSPLRMYLYGLNKTLYVETDCWWRARQGNKRNWISDLCVCLVVLQVLFCMCVLCFRREQRPAGAWCSKA